MATFHSLRSSALFALPYRVSMSRERARHAAWLSFGRRVTVGSFEGGRALAAVRPPADVVAGFGAAPPVTGAGVDGGAAVCGAPPDGAGVDGVDGDGVAGGGWAGGAAGGGVAGGVGCAGCDAAPPLAGVVGAGGVETAAV